VRRSERARVGGVPVVADSRSGWSVRPPEASLPRPLRRERRMKRAAPVVAAILVGTCGALLTEGSRSPLEIGTATAMFLTAIVSGLTFPWEKFPRWLEMAPPLLFTVGVVVLREGLSGDGGGLAYSPLLLIPLLGMAFQGNRAELVVQYVAVALALLLPGLWRSYLPGELGRHIVSLAVWALVCVSAREAVGEIRAAERSFSRMLDGLPVGVSVEHGEACRYVNPHLLQMIGRTSSEGLLGRSTLDLVHPDDRESVLASARAASGAESHVAAPHDVRLLHADGNPVVAEMQTVAIEIETKRSVVFSFHDVTSARLREASERRWSEAIALERAKLTTVLGSLEYGVALLDANRRLLYANAAYAAVLGLPASAIAELTRESLVSFLESQSDEPEQIRRRFDEDREFEGDRSVVEFTLARPTRRILRRVAYRTNLTDMGAYVVAWHDVTAEHELLAYRDHLATVDALTGLPNRRGAEKAIEREVSRAVRSRLSLSVAILDIDHFKNVNDTHGHLVGDEVIRRVAAALSDAARGTDTIARWGGEEFLAVLSGPGDGAKEYCERARNLVASLEFPGMTGVTISAGVAEHRLDDEIHLTLTRADARLYEAKRSGRNRVHG